MGNNKLSEKYEVGLMIVSVLIILALVAGLTMNPELGKQIGSTVMFMLTHTFGSFMQFFTLVVLIFLVVIAISKYGDIRFGNTKPEYRTMSWVAMMFFTGLGAGTVYWAFLEWGYHFNAAPMLAGSQISEAYAYELSLAYAIYDWGPAAWALLCIFVLPFAYHYYIKKDNELRFAALCKYSLGEKAVKGWFGKIVNFIFIFAAVGSICISAGSSASTIAAAIADLIGISTSFTLMVIVLIGTAVIYSISSVLGIEKGMRKISDWNVYFCITLLLFIFIFGGHTQYIIYASESMRQTIRLAERLKNVLSPFLITGETGTGKSQLAKYVHSISNRASQPFVAVNCACINPNLIESELFGYKKGAFSGASASGKKGIVQIADKGTLFLDEISEIPMDLQGKLLEFIQEKEFMPLGSEKKSRVDVRIIAATNKDLRQMVENHAFREDLYYRLNAFEVQLPPLRERPEDVRALIDHFLSMFNRTYLRSMTLSDKAREILLQYRWPGNIRELAHIMEKIVVLTDGDVIMPADIPNAIYEIKGRQAGVPGGWDGTETATDEGIIGTVTGAGEGKTGEEPAAAEMTGENDLTGIEAAEDAGMTDTDTVKKTLREALEETECRMVREAYARCGNSVKTAAELGVSQPTAYRLIQKYVTK